MNKLKKLFIYPIVAIALIMLNVILCWGLTEFLAWLFIVEPIDIVQSPMMLVYIITFIGTIYQILCAFQYIDEEL
jgi:hypothetical protein